MTIAALAKDVEQGHVTVSTKTSPGGDSDTVRIESGEQIRMEHAYAVLEVKGSRARIRDPHGSEHWVTDADLAQHFSSRDLARASV